MTLDGPFPIYARDPATGELTDQLAPGEHYKTDAPTLEAFPDVLGPYVVTPQPLQNAWAGDEPAAPAWTVALRFPDAAAADSVRAAVSAVADK